MALTSTKCSKNWLIEFMRLAKTNNSLWKEPEETLVSNFKRNKQNKQKKKAVADLMGCIIADLSFVFCHYIQPCLSCVLECIIFIELVVFLWFFHFLSIIYNLLSNLIKAHAELFISINKKTSILVIHKSDHFIKIYKMNCK
jgi:hypothetical protein